MKEFDSLRVCLWFGLKKIRGDFIGSTCKITPHSPVADTLLAKVLRDVISKKIAERAENFQKMSLSPA